VNLYGFVGNEVSNKFDFLGLLWDNFFNCCGGSVYDEFTECCIDNETFSRQKKETGVTVVTYRNIFTPRWFMPDHSWIEYPGGSCGFYPNDNAGPFDGKQGLIQEDESEYQGQPDDWLHTFDRDPVKLSDCHYNVSKFNECVSTERPDRNFTAMVYDCRDWADEVVSICKARSKK
jgi:hypothetical protein